MSYDGRGAYSPLVIARGFDMAFTITATSGGSAVDLSAATIDAVIYHPITGASVLALTDAVSGVGSNTITLSATDIQTAIDGSDYVWSLAVTRGGDKRPWLAGPVEFVDGTEGIPTTSGTTTTLSVDGDLTVAVDVAAVGGTGGGASALDDLTDVTITTAISGNVLSYNGTGWVNSTPAGGGDMLAANNLSDVASAATARTNLGLAIGTNVQAYDADLAALATAGNSTVLAATTASFLIADESKLDGIEAGADVTDTTNVTAAGALMDSEVDADLKTLSLPANTTISTFGASLVDDADASTARSTLGLGTAATTAATDYATAAQGTTADAAVPKTVVDAKGDILVASAADTVTRLAVGTDTHVLTADSSTATGVKWAAAGGGSSSPAPSLVTPYVKPITGRYYVGANQALVTSRSVPTETMLYPVTLPDTATIDRLGMHISTAGAGGSTVRIGIYNSRADGLAGTILLDAGTIAADSTGFKEITVSQSLVGGTTYWMAYTASAGAINAWGFTNTNVNYDLGRTSGALATNTITAYYAAGAATLVDLTSQTLVINSSNYACVIYRVA